MIRLLRHVSAGIFQSILLPLIFIYVCLCVVIKNIVMIIPVFGPSNGTVFLLTTLICPVVDVM